jgi:hypothetical protein
MATNSIGYGTCNFALNISVSAKKFIKTLPARLGFQSENQLWQEYFVRGLSIEHPEIGKKVRALFKERKPYSAEGGTAHSILIGLALISVAISQAMCRLVAGDLPEGLHWLVQSDPAY